MPLNKTRNAIELLKHDHREVESLFSEFEAEDSDERKLQLGRKICIELTIHAQIEEELFYPAAKQTLPDKKAKLVPESLVEHTSLKELISSINGTAVDDEFFEARFTVLKEYVQHHVKEEEGELMPAVKRTDVDLDELGQALAERKDQLKEEMGAEREPSGRSRKISLPKPSSAARLSGRTRSSKPAARTSASKAPARRSTTAPKSSARKRTQAQRARAGSH